VGAVTHNYASGGGVSTVSIAHNRVSKTTHTHRALRLRRMQEGAGGGRQIAAADEALARPAAKVPA